MKSVIENFYSAFSSLDAEAMVNQYHDDVVFEDPAFGKLHGEHAKNMWRMLLGSQTKDSFKVNYDSVQGDAESGSAHWEADYTFSKTGRKVHNKIDAKFEFKDGKIIKHVDSFNVHKWAGQAMGLSGKLIGWTSFFKKKLNAQTNSLLAKYEAGKS